MKKLIIGIFCISCITIDATAQSGVRIGNLEFIVKKAERDSVIRVFAQEDPCPPCPSEKETRPKPKPQNPYKYDYTYKGFCGIGFILPDKSSDYYTTLGGNSINIDMGGMRHYHISRRFALGGTAQYSFYNYRLRDAASDSLFARETTIVPYERQDIRKQVFRSHNVAIGPFMRFYIIPPRYKWNDGLYLDLGAQGDFAFSKYYKIKMRNGDKDKIRNADAFNPFTASAIARIGWRGWRGWQGSTHTIFVRYRFTNAFNSEALPADLPPITIGIQFF